MSNDTTTLSGSLDEMKDQLISELGDKGVTATFDSTTGLLGLIGEISNIQTGGGGCPQLVTGTFTTGSTGGSSGTVNLSYNGNGYPIMALVYVDGGLSKTGTDWYTTIARYDCGLCLMVKSQTDVTPTWSTSGSANYGTVDYIYKSSTSSATSYSRSGSQTANTYTSSSTDASTGSVMIRFKGNGKTLSYYTGNRTSSTYGLARNTKFAYIVIYSEQEGIHGIIQCKVR